jgi:hypothetical protein
MYFGGRGVAPDPIEAASWWKKSIAHGDDPRPAFSLGQLYWLNDAVPRDTELALKYWRLAKKLGSEDAVVALAVAEANAPEEVDREALGPLAAWGQETARGTIRFCTLAKAGIKTLVKEVPFVHQAHNFCGVASSTMLLRHQGVKVSQYDVARVRRPNRWGEGSHWTELASVSGKFGHRWKIRSFPNTDKGFTEAKAALVAELTAGRPVIIDILEKEAGHSAHSILICAYDPKSGDFVARNPALPFPGYQVFPEERLKVIWRSRGFIPANFFLLRPMMFIDAAGAG